MVSVHRIQGRLTLVYRGRVAGFRRWLNASRSTALRAWIDSLGIN